MSDTNRNNKAPHILNTSSNLLGLCFIVLTSLHVLKLKETSIIDELTAVAIVLFMTASLLSFLSMRSNTVRSERYEQVADVFFLSGLVGMFITTMLVAFGVIQ